MIDKSMFEKAYLRAGYKTQAAFAEALGYSKSALNYKLKNNAFTTNDIVKFSEITNANNQTLIAIFFPSLVT